MSHLHEARFIDLFMQAAGHSEIPRQYFFWSGLSLIAACLNDRVWYEKYHGVPLYPNLYITLTGDSGSGKDFAIDFASSFVSKLKSVHEYYGKVSGAGLADVLAKPEARRSGINNRPTVWLVLPELSNSIGKGALADDFIKRLTALHGGKNKVYKENTRALMREGNELSYDSPVINCLFGSAQRWLIDSVSPEAIYSGAFARFFIVEGSVDYGPSGRIYRPTRPANYEEIMDELGKRVKAITRLNGEFRLSKQADAIAERWYNTRPEPLDDRMRPSWKRLEELIWKLAMCLSPAVQVGYDKLLITSEAVIEAQRLAHSSYSNLPNIMRWAARTGKTSDLEKVHDLVEEAGRIPHSALLRKVTHHGIHAKELKDHITALVDRGNLLRVRNRNGGVVYEWKTLTGKKRRRNGEEHEGAPE